MHAQDEMMAQEMDFASLLEEAFAQDNFRVGDIVNGEVLAVDNQGIIVGIGTQHDGLVSRRDIERLGLQPEDYGVGTMIDVVILRLDDDAGNYVLSVSQAQQYEDWRHAEALMESQEVWQGQIVDANRGGIIIGFGHLRGFVPASHVADLPRGIEAEERQQVMQQLVGKKIGVKVIEVNRQRRRLVFSQREAQREQREAQREALLEKLEEGAVLRGVVSGMRDFGAFVDLGGVDGLIHISELAWRRIGHPSEVLEVGQEVETYVLNIDDDGRRIALSLKRLQPNPWSMVETLYHVGQLIEGEVCRLAHFGAFITLDPGIEALLHISQMAEEPPEEVSVIAEKGDTLLMRIISIEPEKQRLGLSLKAVTEDERLRWEQKESEFEAVPG